MKKMLAPALAALSLALPGAGQAQVKIGFINSITGPEAPIGENLTNGVDMAVEDLKKKGVAVTVVKQDDTGKPQVAMSAMETIRTAVDLIQVSYQIDSTARSRVDTVLNPATRVPANTFKAKPIVPRQK